MKSITGAILILASVYALGLKDDIQFLALILFALSGSYLFTDRELSLFRISKAKSGNQK